ncbi:hypothetical protein ARMSODRAFT_965208, partial [Armillaria solidipes]
LNCTCSYRDSGVQSRRMYTGQLKFRCSMKYILMPIEWPDTVPFERHVGP